MAINCSGCYAPCCRMLQLVPKMAKYDREDGVCKHLDNENKCRIYNERPEICRVEENADLVEVEKACCILRSLVKVR